MTANWSWAPRVDSALREALAAAFDPSTLEPAVTDKHRHVRGRSYGILRRRGPLPIDVFVKSFQSDSLLNLVRQRPIMSGLREEFENNVRLHAMGLPVPGPLAFVEERGPRGLRRCHVLTEHPADVRSLAQWLRPGAASESDLEVLVRTSAGLLLKMAAHGIWHRDARPANILLALSNKDRPPTAFMVDLRHMASSPGPWPQALQEMLSWHTAFMLTEDADPRWARRLIEAAADLDRQEGRGLLQAKPEEIFARGLAQARELLAREVRKERRQAGALDVFAHRYATADDAQNYRDRRFGRSRHGRKVDAAERRLVWHVVADLEPCDSVLDVPCGTGRFLPIFDAMIDQVIGADVSEEMLNLARASVGHGPGERPVPCLAADARSLPFPDGSFDLVFSMRLLHRVVENRERIKVLAELTRVSRRWVLFSFYNRRTWSGLRDRLRGRYSGETRRAIAAEVAEAGLRLERFLPAGLVERQTLVLCSVKAMKG